MYKKEFYEYIEELDSHEDVKKMKKYMQHGKVSTYAHAKQVAYFSFFVAKRLKLKVDLESLTKGAFLHDFYLYDYHDLKADRYFHGVRHPKIASKNAHHRFGINEKERNIIESHMWPLSIHRIPKSREAIIVCLMDKYCAIREYINLTKGLVFSSENN